MGAPGSHGFCHTPCLTELARRLSPGGDGGCKSRTRRRDLGIFGESTRDPSGRKDRPQSAKGGRQQASVCAQGSQGGNCLNVTEGKGGFRVAISLSANVTGAADALYISSRTENKRFWN